MSSIFEKNPENTKFNSPTPHAITIMAGDPTRNISGLDPSICQKMASYGFNAAATSITQSAISSSLTNCLNNNLKLFVRNANMIYNYTESFVKQYENHTALGGWFLDIQMSLNPELQDTPVADLVNANKLITQNSSKPVFIGLNGDWLDNRYYRPASFPDYIAKIQEDFQPSFWPYCFFPDLTPPAGAPTKEERIENFYKSLQYFAYVGRYTSTPFWVFIRGMAMSDMWGYTGDAPTENVLRGIVFSSLAHGAKGLFYWDMGKLLVESDKEANKKQLEIIDKINKEVNLFNDVFADCEVLDCRHSLINGNFKWKKRLDHSMGPLVSIERLTIRSCDLLFSHIFNKRTEQNYLIMVVSPFTSEALPSIKLIFSEYWNVNRVLISGDQLIERELTDYNFSFLGHQGSYYVFRWE